jgi:hypothetical protein
MEQLVDKIHRALEANNYLNTQLVGMVPYIWRFAQVKYKGVSSRAAKTGFFDEVITGLLNVEEGLSFNRLGHLMGFSIEDDLPQMLKADEAEIELLADAIESLKQKEMISGDENGYYLKERGKILAKDGWMPEEVPIEFSIFLDGLDTERVNQAGKIFPPWNLRKTLSREDIILKNLSDALHLNEGASVKGRLLTLSQELSQEQEVQFGVHLLESNAETGQFVYQVNPSSLSFEKFAQSLSNDIEKLRNFAYEHDPKAHYPEEKCQLLSEPRPQLTSVSEKGVEVAICLLGNPAEEKVRVEVFNPVSGMFSEYLTSALNENPKLQKNLIAKWIEDNPDLEHQIVLSDREKEIKEELRKEQEFNRTSLEEAKSEEDIEEIIERINTGRKAFDEYGFEREISWLFGMAEKEIWLNFPRLRKQPLKVRTSQIREALERGVNIFLAYSKDYINEDNMHDKEALSTYTKLNEEYPNFFLCEVDLSHKRTILAIANEDLRFEYTPSYNIMSFSPYGIEEEIAKEINYRVPWDNESQKEYDYLKEKFIDQYRTQFEEFMNEYPGGYDYKTNARRNHDRIKGDLINASHWAKFFGIDEELVEKRVERYLSDKVGYLVNQELGLLERQLNDKSMTSKEGKIPPREAVGRLYSIEAWAKVPDVEISLDALHRCSVIRAGYFDSYPELSKKGGKKRDPRKNRKFRKR